MRRYKAGGQFDAEKALSTSQVTEMAASHTIVWQKLSKMAEFRLDCVIPWVTVSHSDTFFTTFLFVFRFHICFMKESKK